MSATAGPWSHYCSPFRFYGAERIGVGGQFLPASSTTATTTALALVKQAAGSITMSRGLGFSVTHDATNTGQYDVLLDQDPTDLIVVLPSFGIAALPGSAPSVILSPGTILQPAANANVRAGSGQAFHFALTYLVGNTPTDMGTNSSNESFIGFLAIIKATQQLA